MWPNELIRPLTEKDGKHILVCPQGDLFHSAIPDPYLMLVLMVMLITPERIYYLLTKRPGRMRKILASFPFWPLPNVNIGTSAENQFCLDTRANELSSTQVHPDAFRYLSCEPLLAPVQLGSFTKTIKWVIFGAEKKHYGTGRPMDPEWAAALKAECQAAGIPYYHHRSSNKVDLQKPGEPISEVPKLLEIRDGKTQIYVSDLQKVRNEFPSGVKLAAELEISKNILSEVLYGRPVSNPIAEKISTFFSARLGKPCQFISPPY